MKTVINIKAYKNTTNRHRMEAVRLLSLVKRGLMTKQEAIDTYTNYLECQFGRQVIREYPYKKAS
jgi:hypothetical protein